MAEHPAIQVSTIRAGAERRERPRDPVLARNAGLAAVEAAGVVGQHRKFPTVGIFRVGIDDLDSLAADRLPSQSFLVSSNPNGSTRSVISERMFRGSSDTAT
jgi:hypothetical protein